MITLADQIKEAQRERALRKKVYPKLVQRQQLTEGQAPYHPAAMEAIVATLAALATDQAQSSLFDTQT
jgi:cytochrome c556